MELIDMASDEAKQAAVKTAGGTVQLAVRVAGGSAGLGADAVVAVARRLRARRRTSSGRPDGFRSVILGGRSAGHVNW